MHMKERGATKKLVEILHMTLENKMKMKNLEEQNFHLFHDVEV